MKYSRKQLSMVIISWFILVLSAFIVIKTQFPAIPEEPSINLGIEVFYNIFNGNRTIYFIVLLFTVIPSLFVINNYKMKENNFINSINLRISFDHYRILALRDVFIKSCIFYLLMNLSILLFIHFFYCPISLVKPTLTSLLSQNAIFDLIIYLILGTFGFGFYNIFLLQVIYFINNEFLFRSFSIINFVIALIFVALTIPLLLSLSDGNEIFRIYSSFMAPVNLITPGLLFEMKGFLSFGLSFVFYSLVSALLWALAKPRVMNNA